MKQLRSHTARLTVILLLCAGFGFYLARPAQAEQSSQAFTHWFGTMAKSGSAVNLQQELNDLQKSSDHLNKVIEKASQIISRNNDEFSFPFAESTASQHVYQLLLIEWNQFQTGNEMASIPVQPTAKLLSSANFETTGGFGTTAIKPAAPHKPYLSINKSAASQINHTVSLIPMSSGIAICAP